MPSHQERFQDLLGASFDNLFPRYSPNGGGMLDYWFLLGEQTQAFQGADFVDPDQMKLILGELLFRGWQRLKDETLRQGASRAVKKLVRDFRIPDPRADLSRYLIYRDHLGCQRLAILWAENPSSSFIHIEQAIAYFRPNYRPHSALENRLELRNGQKPDLQGRSLVPFK